MEIIISDFPMPPSHNLLYDYVKPYTLKNGITQKKWKYSTVYKDYISVCYEWSFKHYARLKKIKKDIGASTGILKLDTFFIFPYTKIFSKSGAIKKIDASNRLKACHDCFSEIVGLDDKHFFCGYFGKYPTSDDDERVIMVVSEMETAELKRFLNPNSYLSLNN